MVADRIVAELRTNAGGDFSELIVLPMSAVAQLVGLSATRAAQKLPITESAKGKHGVTIANIREFVKSRTKFPQS